MGVFSKILVVFIIGLLVAYICKSIYQVVLTILDRKRNKGKEENNLEEQEKAED